MGISIHAPRAGSDLVQLADKLVLYTFQSTLPVRGATLADSIRLLAQKSFQSTLPVRGATLKLPKPVHGLRNFNPRSPCGERLYHRAEI